MLNRQVIGAVLVLIPTIVWLGLLAWAIRYGWREWRRCGDWGALALALLFLLGMACSAVGRWLLDSGGCP